MKPSVLLHILICLMLYLSEQAENDLEDLYAYAETLTMELSALKVQLFACICQLFTCVNNNFLSFFSDRHFVGKTEKQ